MTPCASSIASAAPRSGTAPDVAVSVIVNVHRVLAGAPSRRGCGTAGPTAVASARPCAGATETVSPSIASPGCAGLADTIPPTSGDQWAGVIRPNGLLNTSGPNGARPRWAA